MSEHTNMSEGRESLSDALRLNGAMQFVTNAQILDACCGGRMWWWEKDHELALYMDRREDPPGSCSHRPNWSCEPDIIGDFRQMPLADDSFQLVLFDPPHLVREDPSAVLRGKIGLRYGCLAKETEQDDLRQGFAECWRVLAPGGTLIFKWSGLLDRVRPHFPATPIVGTRWIRGTNGKGLGTRWFVFYKPLEAADFVQEAAA